MYSVRFAGVSKAFGSKIVLNDLSFELESGKIYCLLGESGSGKTTALRLMNGLLTADRGAIEVAGKNIDDVDTVELRREMGYAIQGSGLFPHMTVEENVSLIARRIGWDRDRCRSRAAELLHLVNMEPSAYLDKKPRQISGGQQQRVGLVRALFLQPKLLLMDEPFGALDPITREDIQDEFIDMQKKLHFSAVIVTHDLNEAFKLSHRVLLLNGGNLDQFGKPSELISQPATPYVKNLVQRFLKNRQRVYD